MRKTIPITNGRGGGNWQGDFVVSQRKGKARKERRQGKNGQGFLVDFVSGGKKLVKGPGANSAREGKNCGRVLYEGGRGETLEKRCRVEPREDLGRRPISQKRLTKIAWTSPGGLKLRIGQGKE